MILFGDCSGVQMMDLSGLARGAVAARPFAGGLASAAANDASGAPSWATGGGGFEGSFGDANNTSSNNNKCLFGLASAASV